VKVCCGVWCPARWYTCGVVQLSSVDHLINLPVVHCSPSITVVVLNRIHIPVNITASQLPCPCVVNVSIRRFYKIPQLLTPCKALYTMMASTRASQTGKFEANSGLTVYNEVD
jgi:hypothetical protein